MEHAAGIELTAVPSGTGCVECLRAHGWWVHLRRCAACGHIGCCDSSPSQQARAHAAAVSHPIVRSYEPGEDWFWDYTGDSYVSGPLREFPEPEETDRVQIGHLVAAAPNPVDLIIASGNMPHRQIAPAFVAGRRQRRPVVGRPRQLNLVGCYREHLGTTAREQPLQTHRAPVRQRPRPFRYWNPIRHAQFGRRLSTARPRTPKGSHDEQHACTTHKPRRRCPMQSWHPPSTTSIAWFRLAQSARWIRPSSRAGETLFLMSHREACLHRPCASWG